jgi:hypothetical protein
MLLHMLESGVVTSIVVSGVAAPIATSSVVAHAEVFVCCCTC